MFLFVQQADLTGYVPRYSVSDFGAMATDATGFYPATQWEGVTGITSTLAGQPLKGEVPDIPAAQDCLRVYNDGRAALQHRPGDRQLPDPVEVVAMLQACEHIALFADAARRAGINPTRQLVPRRGGQHRALVAPRGADPAAHLPPRPVRQRRQLRRRPLAIELPRPRRLLPPHRRVPARPVTDPDSAPALDIRGVDFSYGQVQVLFGIDLTVPAGEAVALLGTNGAGKSTLLKAVCGLVRRQRRHRVLLRRRHHPSLHGQARGRRPGAGPRRPLHLPVAHRRGEPPGRRVDLPPQPGARGRAARAGARAVPRARATGSRRRPARCRAASSRCSPSGGPSCSSPACC